ncbi:hypothetical protein [Streptomyces acidiscabies]|uniref:hypothetical protein n=1 Tax=Streptomyces acidiscabies TaxID=42234 RepID=UPI00067B7E24|nr:hypothetical protein [Streptomyces acidiscabies]
MALPRYDPRQSSPQVIREWLDSSLPAGTEPDKNAPAGVTMLPLGEVFTAVRMTARLVHAAAGSDEPEALSAFLAEALNGPVIHHPTGSGCPYYALTPYRKAEWPLPDGATYRGTGTWLGVPDLDRRGPHGVHWLIPPRYRGDLCRLEYVYDLILQGFRALIPAAVEGEGQ